MTRKQIVILISLVVFMAAVVFLGIIFGSRSGVKTPQAVENFLKSNNNKATSSLAGGAAYTSQIPSGATPSTPLNSAPANSNPASTAQIKTFNLSASASGFSPDSFTVNQGDTLKINFTAVDGDYDFAIPYLGASFNAVPKGQTKIFPIDTSAPGTFLFECQNSCPAAGKIQGTLIVLPKK